MLGEVLRRELKFESLDPVSITDRTDDIREIVKSLGVVYGQVDIRSPHTTLGLFVNEITPNIVRDLINTSLQIPEDSLSTWFTENRIPWFLANGYNAPIPSTKYLHWCGENPALKPGEKDDDRNFARHLRAMLFTRESVNVPIIENELDLGRFQRIGVWEHDGRDGLGLSGNPKRVRTLQVWIQPYSSVRFID